MASENRLFHEHVAEGMHAIFNGLLSQLSTMVPQPLSGLSE
jgi:hypothetical protein